MSATGWTPVEQPPAGWTPVETAPASAPAAQEAPDEGWWSQNVSGPVNKLLDKIGAPTYGGSDTISKHLTKLADYLNKPESQAAMSVLGGGMGTTLTNAADQVVPSTERAAQHFRELSNMIGEHTVGMTDALSDATQEVSKLAKSGGQMPKVLSDFTNRIFDTDQGPLTYDEVRRFMTMAGRKMSDLMDINSQRVRDPEMIRAMGNWYGELRNAVEETADKAGQLAKFQDAMSEFRGAMKARTAIKTATAAAGTAAVPSVLKYTPAGHAVGGFLKDMLGY